MNFPLYNSLITSVNDKDLTTSQKKTFIEKVQLIDMEGKELLVALIKNHFVLSEGDYISKPYNCIIDNSTTSELSDLTFDLESFPSILKQMLYKFLKLHIKKMKDDRFGDKNQESMDETFE
jgi:hypothetical protein